MKAYEYNNKIYLNEMFLDEGIEQAIGHDYNNAVGLERAVEEESVNAEVLDLNSFDTFKMWCEQENLNPSHATSVSRYFKEAMIGYTEAYKKRMLERLGAR